jgi:hypothetical protein
VNTEKCTGSGLHEELFNVNGEACEYTFSLVIVDSAVNEFGCFNVLITLNELIAGDNDITARACDCAYSGIYALTCVNEFIEELLVMSECFRIESTVVDRCNRGLILFEEVFFTCSDCGRSLTALTVFPVADEFISVKFH